LIDFYLDLEESMKTLPIPIDDWLSSPLIQSLDAFEERGLLRLLLYAVRQADCGLPAADAELAVISLLGSQWYKPTGEKGKRIENLTSGHKLRAAFVEKNGRLYNEALLREWQHQTQIEQARRRASRIGNERRWGNRLPKGSHMRLANGSQAASRAELSPDCKPPAEIGGSELHAEYHELLRRWPPDKRGVDLGAQVWISLVDLAEITEANVSELFDGLERWKASELWRKDNGRYIPAIANPQATGWLQKRAWKDHPKPAGEDF
jgi:hypothetical protein